MPLTTTKNELLLRLPSDLRAKLAPHFVRVPLTLRQPIYDLWGVVDKHYFVERGVISMVTDLADGGTVETGTIGREGISGIAHLLGRSRSANRVFVQVPGDGYVIDAALLERELPAAPAWNALLMRYGHFLSVMMGQNAACNRVHDVAPRMVRWLLMCHDRVGEETFTLTQEFLAQMLGVTRTSVNIQAAILKRTGFIDYTRGDVRILNRPGLESIVCECYETIRTAQMAMLDPSGHSYDR